MQLKMKEQVGDFNIFSPILQLLKINANILMKYRFLLLGFLLALISPAAFAQTADAYVTGRVVIMNGDEKEGVYDAQVDLLKDGNDLKGRVKTDGDGYFRIGPVDAGRYSLKIQSTEVPDAKIVPN